MTTYWENVWYLLEYEKIKKIFFWIIGKRKNRKMNFWIIGKRKKSKKELMIFLFLDVATLEVRHQMTTY